MKKTLTTLTNKDIIIACLVLLILYILFFPPLSSFHFFELSRIKQIGDALSGIFMPVLSALTIWLLYITFNKQAEAVGKQAQAIEITVHEANFKIIYNELAKLQISIDEFEYRKQTGFENKTGRENKKGKEAIKECCGAFLSLPGTDINSYDEKLDHLQVLLNKFNRMIRLIENLKTSTTYSDIISKDLCNIYDSDIKDSIILSTKWTENKELNEKRTKVKQTIDNIERKIKELTKSTKTHNNSCKDSE